MLFLTFNHYSTFLLLSKCENYKFKLMRRTQQKKIQNQTKLLSYGVSLLKNIVSRDEINKNTFMFTFRPTCGSRQNTFQIEHKCVLLSNCASKNKQGQNHFTVCQKPVKTQVVVGLHSVIEHPHLVCQFLLKKHASLCSSTSSS